MLLNCMLTDVKDYIGEIKIYLLHNTIFYILFYFFYIIWMCVRKIISMLLITNRSNRKKFLQRTLYMRGNSYQVSQPNFLCHINGSKFFEMLVLPYKRPTIFFTFF